MTWDDLLKVFEPREIFRPCFEKSVRNIRQVIKEIAKHVHELEFFPNEKQLKVLMREFYKNYGLPSVCQKHPRRGEDHAERNFKIGKDFFHSEQMSIQTSTSPMFCVVSHDCMIFNTISCPCADLEAENVKGVQLGDKGYQFWISATRGMVEEPLKELLDQLKQRFRCLRNVIWLSLDVGLDCILMCFCLHCFA